MISPYPKGRQHPAEAGKARALWHEFMVSGLERLRAGQSCAVDAESKRYIVHVATRPSTSTEFVLRNAVFQLGIEWGLQVLVREDLEPWIRSIVDGWGGVHVDTLPGAAEGDVAPGMDDLKRRTDFWQAVRGEVQLFVDEESIVCNPDIDPFLAYDYVGAPWGDEHVSPWCRFGSGGLSLRRKAAMTKACRECNTNSWMIGSEDVFFSIVMRLEKDEYRLPPYELARRFAVERVYHPAPFALHRTWEYIGAEKLRALLRRIKVAGVGV